MPKTRINCPNCRQPIVADIDQLFDVNVDPSAKQKFLSGTFNVVQCPHCGYQGQLATPIVYHDPDKELLLTYVPPEINLPHDEQERVIGSLINQAVNNLPQEKRKGYLFQPKAHLTLQSLVEHVLEADGISREMIEGQQKRLNLLQRIASISDKEARVEVIKQEEELIDSEFFAILSRLHEAAEMSGDEESLKRLEDLQEDLMENTEIGRQIKEQSEEIQAALKSLQESGRELTREKLLDLVVSAPTETRLSAFVSLARPAMDYTFFQMLSDRIDRARSSGRQRLIELRERLLELTSEFDEQMKVRSAQSLQLLESILKSEDVRNATLQNLPNIDEFFLQIVNQELEAARKRDDQERLRKLQEMVDVLERASAPPPEVTFLEELLEAPDEQARRALLEERQEEVTPRFLEMISGLVVQMQQSNQDEEFIKRLQSIVSQVRRFSMQVNLRGS
jgi:hypothetical protein